MKIRSSEITPESVYYANSLTRRRFLGVASSIIGGLALSACANSPLPTTPKPTTPESPTQAANPSIQNTPTAQAQPSPTKPATDELGDTLTPYDAITTYNNFYEFSYDKQAVANVSKKFVSSPWQIQVGGLVNKPMTLDLDDLLKFSQIERIYRLRCVEAWSMVIPWVGFRLADLIKKVEPRNEAKYVRFESLLDPNRMPGQRDPSFPWPYVEGLRMDEAMHDLTLMATGIYGKSLLPQSGAPIRLVVPWKYGFKSIKSIVKIDFVTDQPSSLWMKSAPNEYGFYANVNPEVSHPRWSQSSERRIGEFTRRRTIMFNGYDNQVSSLYAGMDLRKNY
jgi:sulfoxide reductase catalytic subunit YedY